MMHFILAIDWTEPAIFAPLVGAAGIVIGAVIPEFFKLWARKKDKAENASPEQQQTQITKVGLDEDGVGQALKEQLGPVEQ